MKKSPPPNRHLSWEFLSERIKRGTPSREQVQGKPTCDVIVEARGRRLALRVNCPPQKDERLPFFAAVECIRIGTGTKSCVQLSCTDRERYQEFYAFLSNVADRVQLHGARVDEAIAGAADSVRDLLAGGAALSLERQIGLWGELWALDALANRTDWSTAVQSWVANAQGPEEHDFALPALDVEVKTTSSELRRHHISSSEQLSPKLGRRLIVLSVQITAGGAAGITLSDAVSRVREAAPRSVRAKLEKALKAAGWHDIEGERYSTRWIHRTAPTAIDAVLLPRLQVLGAHPERVISLSYVLDVSGMGESALEALKCLN